jgi:hypothetical protein
MILFECSNHSGESGSGRGIVHAAKIQVLAVVEYFCKQRDTG